jgi:hypothetical protein
VLEHGDFFLFAYIHKWMLINKGMYVYGINVCSLITTFFLLTQFYNYKFAVITSQNVLALPPFLSTLPIFATCKKLSNLIISMVRLSLIMFIRLCIYVFSLLSLFKQIKVGLSDHLAVCIFVSVYPPINFWMPDTVFMKLGVYIMAPKPISTAYFRNPSHQSMCQYVYPHIVARQRLCKHVPAATNNCWRCLLCVPCRVKEK